MVLGYKYLIQRVLLCYVFQQSYLQPIGGLPTNVRKATGGQFLSGFDGCLSDVQFNEVSESVNFASPVNSEGQHIVTCPVVSIDNG